VSARGAAVTALLVALAVGVRSARAQIWPNVGGDALLANAHFHGTGTGGSEALGGVIAALQVRYRLIPVVLEASYAQGRLTASGGGAEARTFAEAKLFVIDRPLSWLTVSGGPHLRAYAVPGAIERWMLLEAHARAEGPAILGTLRPHVELWLALLAGVNANPGASGARGGEAGFTVEIPHTPLLGRVDYAVDRASMKNGVRTEALERLVVGVSYGVR
jgi:hypothetical protein